MTNSATPLELILEELVPQRLFDDPRRYFFNSFEDLCISPETVRFVVLFLRHYDTDGQQTLRLLGESIGNVTGMQNRYGRLTNALLQLATERKLAIDPEVLGRIERWHTAARQMQELLDRAERRMGQIDAMWEAESQRSSPRRFRRRPPPRARAAR